MALGQSCGPLLRQLRRAAGLTQEALAERAGMSARGLQDLERGVSQAPRRRTIDRDYPGALGHWMSLDHPRFHSLWVTRIVPVTQCRGTGPGRRGSGENEDRSASNRGEPH